MSSCPEFKEELEKMEEQKRVEKLGPLLSKKDAEVIFVKPVLEPQERKSKSFMRAPSLEGHLHIPHGARRSPSPLGTYSMRIRNLREGSPASHKDEPTQVIRLRLRKQPSVDSGINLDVHTVKNMQKDIIQLSKYVLISPSSLLFINPLCFRNNRSLSLPSTGFQKAASISLPGNPSRQGAGWLGQSSSK